MTFGAKWRKDIQSMSESDSHQREFDAIEAVSDKPAFTKFLAYTKLSGPGWLQGAITLGGGSLAGALYLGVISGYGLMWLQPLAMICGIIMLSAIAYVTLSTGQRPFSAINRHLNPLLGWAWLIATIMANIVWCMPQFALGTAAIQQNLFSEDVPSIAIIIVLFALGLFVNVLYQSGGKGTRAFDLIIKVMVGIIVLSFFAVVITLTTTGVIDRGRIFVGYIPDLSLLFKPAPIFTELIARSSDPDWWAIKIAGDQKDIIIAAFGTAVGINMTWLLPYSLLKKRWGPKHRGLSIVDLSIGLFIPFFLATSCVVIAAASSFHGKTGDVLRADGTPKTEYLVPIEKTLQSLPSIKKIEDPAGREVAMAGIPDADRILAAMLVKRDTKVLAVTLEPLAGKIISQRIFGIGVLGMALSTIIILMLINGIAFQELFTPAPPGPLPPGARTEYKTHGPAHFLGCVVSGLAGASFPLLWEGKAHAALAVPTSVIGGSLLPIAYFTFLLLMNSRRVLGDKRPEGTARIIWNVLMVFATSIATFGSVWVLLGKTNAPGWKGGFAWGGLAFLVLLFLVGITSFLRKEKQATP